MCQPRNIKTLPAFLLSCLPHSKNSRLPKLTLPSKVESMNPNWAEENLQTIRTLMERSALYRRALAPIMIFCGVIGVLGGVVGACLHMDSDAGFLLFWVGTAGIALGGTFFLVRRQALKDAEPFWSPPTRRISQALLPAFFIAAFLTGVSAYMVGARDRNDQVIFIVLWTWFFGCAVHAAGSFVQRGMKLFGWLFIAVGCGLLVLSIRDRQDFLGRCSPHLLMAAIFGGLHLAYGIYLYCTEKKTPNA
jgi:hypothetical protein